MTESSRLSMVRLVAKGDGASVPEWSGIELQGSLAQRDGEANPSGRMIGDLTLVGPKGERAILIIGNHQLKGKKVTLAKPLAVTRKRAREAYEGSENRGEVDDSTGKTDSSAKRQRSSAESEGDDDEVAVDSTYEIVGVMRNKYVFKTRPKPINAKLAMSKKANKP